MKRFIPLLAGILVLAFVGTAAVMSPDWFGLAAAVAPAARLPLDETEAKSVDLQVPATIKLGESAHLEGKLDLNTKAYQWGGNTTMSLSFSGKRPSSKPKAMLVIEVVRGSSFSQSDTVVLTTMANIDQTSAETAKWSTDLLLTAGRPGSYRLRVYFQTYVPGRIPRKLDSNRLIAETDLVVQ